MITGLSWTELAKQIFLFIFVQKLWCCKLNKFEKCWFRGCISAKCLSIENKLGTLHQHHDLRFHAKVGNSVTCGSWVGKKSTLLIITFGNIVQMLLFLYSLIPCNRQILTMSHLSFSINVLVSHIKVNTKQFFRYSSFKIGPIFPKIGRDDLWTEPHRTDWTEFFVLGVKKKVMMLCS